MSMISEQVKELRELADDMEKYVGLRPKPRILREAANTIESLSAKLRAANMEEKNKNIKKHLKYGFCPDCGNAVGRGASTCFECGTIIDWDLLKEDDKRSAENCGGWIPCNERLPEEEGMYLITSKVFGKTEVQYVFFQKNIDLFICNGIPTAWKPLPEPYHEP